MTETAMTSNWAAPYRSTPIDAEVRLPGSKSLTNRVLVLSALADAPSQVRAPLQSRDTALMAGALRSLGVAIEESGAIWTVTPPSWGGQTRAARVDCGLAGTVMRFVPPVAALTAAPVTFDGDPYARERPMGTIIASLRDLGVRIEDEGRGTMPFDLLGSGHVDGGVVTIDASASSQFVSALLLAAPRYARGIDVRHVGKPVPSMPHIEMTITELRRRGVTVDDSEPHRWIVEPGPVSALDCVVEPDLSNAGTFVAAALVTGGTVRIPDWPESTDQAGDRWRELAALFGAGVSTDDGTLEVRAARRPHAVQLDLRDEGELTPVVAAVCAVADGPSHLTGIGHLRGHETDRLAAIAAEVNRLGGDVTEHDEGLTINPRPMSGAVLRTYADHRMAHAAAVLGLTMPGVEVEDVETTAKTFPGFSDVWERFAS